MVSCVINALISIKQKLILSKNLKICIAMYIFYRFRKF